jgi:hypothetical protein
MKLWFLCTALPLHEFDHCMKLYWIPTISLQVMLRPRKLQRTVGPTTGWLLYTPKSLFWENNDQYIPNNILTGQTYMHAIAYKIISPKKTCMYLTNLHQWNLPHQTQQHNPNHLSRHCHHHRNPEIMKNNK